MNAVFFSTLGCCVCNFLVFTKNSIPSTLIYFSLLCTGGRFIGIIKEKAVSNKKTSF